MTQASIFPARRSWLATLLGVGVAVVLGIVGLQVVALGPDGLLAVAIGLLVVSNFAPVVAWRISPLSPAFVHSVFVFIGIGLGAVAWFGHPYGANPVVGQEWVTRAVFLVAAGMVAFWVGYGLSPAPRDVRGFVPQTSVPIWAVLFIFAAGLAANAVLFTTGQFGYLATFPTDASPWVQWIQTTTGLTSVAIFIASIHAFGNNSKPHQRILVVMLVAVVILGVVSGVKGNAVWPLAWTIFIYYFFKRRIPRGVIPSVLIASFLLVPANNAYRTQLRGTANVDTSSAESVVSTATQTLSTSSHMALPDRIALMGQWTSARFRNIDSLAAILRLTPSRYPYLGGGLYAQAPAVILVPRFLWPDKPVLDLGYQFNQKYFNQSADVHTSAAVTNQGDLYMHFGYLGVIVGMALWGAAAAALFRWFGRRRSPQALLVFVTALSLFSIVESDFVSLLGGAFRTLLMTVVVARLVYRSGVSMRNLPWHSTPAAEIEGTPRP